LEGGPCQEAKAKALRLTPSSHNPVLSLKNGLAVGMDRARGSATGGTMA
jgi:hypothetical protein